MKFWLRVLQQNKKKIIFWDFGCFYCNWGKNNLQCQYFNFQAAVRKKNEKVTFLITFSKNKFGLFSNFERGHMSLYSKLLFKISCPLPKQKIWQLNKFVEVVDLLNIVHSVFFLNRHGEVKNCKKKNFH